MEPKTLRLPEIVDDGLFEKIEHGKWHTPYEQEILFYSAIGSGDVKRLERIMQTILNDGLAVGRMSADSLRQMQYFAVCCVTLATRYAIQGGLPQTAAYDFADKCLMHIDALHSQQEIYRYLQDAAYELTELVRLAKQSMDYPQAVRDCMAYIEKHLHGKITLRELGEHCALRGDYLSRLFKKSTGQTVSAYIMDRRLETAKAMLGGKYSYSAIGYYLGFSSESYFIACFKKKFGVTPRQYAQSLGY